MLPYDFACNNGNASINVDAFWHIDLFKMNDMKQQTVAYV